MAAEHGRPGPRPQAAPPLLDPSRAVTSRLLVLGVEIQGGGGLLFVLALVVLASAATTAFLRRAKLPALAQRRVRRAPTS